MKKHTDLNILKAEYSTKKNSWKDIYQWERIMSKGNTEVISQMLLLDFKDIKWSDQGIRMNDFKIANHKGQCAIQTPISQFTEKRFCRALFNKYNNESREKHQMFGKIIDYETPLTEPNQIKKKISHGDIDLIAKRKSSLLFIEAKSYNSQESLLKAVLEIFFYTVTLKKFKRIKRLREDFNIDYIGQVIPCILTFRDSTSGEQLLNIGKYPFFAKLLGQINMTLNKMKLGNIEFYVVDNSFKSNPEILYTRPVVENNMEVKIYLNKELFINQYFPELYDDENSFKTNILNASCEKEVEMLYRSYLTYYPDSATSFIVNLMQNIEDEIYEYSKMTPGNSEKVKSLQKELLQKLKYKKAYVKISSYFKSNDFHSINLQLVDQYNLQDLVPQFSGFKCEQTLQKLIDLYNNLRIVSTKDWDGFLSKEIDQQGEKIIIDALCKYDNQQIVPVLEKSLLQGNYNKEKVVRKLLEYKSKSQIYKLVEEYANTYNMLLTDQKEQAKKVITILDEV